MPSRRVRRTPAERSNQSESRRPDYLAERNQGHATSVAFAAATVHDFFNVLAVIILLPVARRRDGTRRRSARPDTAETEQLQAERQVLSGVVRKSSAPIPLVDYLEGGTADTDD